MSQTVLIVDDDPVQRRLLEAMVTRFGYQALTASGGDEGLAHLGGPQRIDCMVLDLVMPDLDGLGVLARMRERGIDIPVIVQTAHGGIDNVVSVMRAGAADFVVKPASPERLQVSLSNALATQALAGELQRIKRSRDGTLSIADVITRSEAMRPVLHAAEKAAASTIPVLIEGESGVGKELIARAIHGSGARRAKPFVAVNCGAMPENLVESILFGHEKGAFTGATDKHTGKFIEADGGTLFLDEVGELPPAAQVKLLRALQEGEVEPVGSRKTVKVDVRIVSATNRDLIADVKAGRFREDLFYRLHVFPISVPPLRRRAEDIPELARHFLARLAAEEGKRLRAIEPEALALLCRLSLAGQCAPIGKRDLPRGGARRRRAHRRRRVPANIGTTRARCRAADGRSLAGHCRRLAGCARGRRVRRAKRHAVNYGFAAAARRARRGAPARGHRARRHPLRHRALPRADVGGRAPAEDRTLDALPQTRRPRPRGSAARNRA